MSNQISAAAELDALPAESLVRTPDGDIWQKVGMAWDCLSETGERGPYLSTTVVHASLDGPPILLFRPDAPAHTEPTEAGLVELLREHNFDRLICYDHEYGSCDPASCHDLRITQEEHYAQLILALLPQRVAPSEEILALWMHDNLGCSLDGCECADKFEYYRAEAHSLAALYASQPTVAEVKAEAWDECVGKIRYLSGSRWTGDDLPNPYREGADHG